MGMDGMRRAPRTGARRPIRGRDSWGLQKKCPGAPEWIRNRKKGENDGPVRPPGECYAVSTTKGSEFRVRGSGKDEESGASLPLATRAKLASAAYFPGVVTPS